MSVPGLAGLPMSLNLDLNVTKPGFDTTPMSDKPRRSGRLYGLAEVLERRVRTAQEIS